MLGIDFSPIFNDLKSWGVASNKFDSMDKARVLAYIDTEFYINYGYKSVNKQKQRYII